MRKASIIIISFNEKDYIEDAFKSCLGQVLNDIDYQLEIIFVDDGSNDGSIDLIKSFQEKYPDTVKYGVMDRSNIQYLIPSIRVSNAIKEAIRLSSGKYIQVLSADDLLVDKFKMSNAIEFLDNNKDYASCYTDYKLFWDNGDEKQPDYKTANYTEKTFWANEYRHISCYVFRREVTDNLLDRMCDDTGLFYSALITGKTKYLPGITFAYRQRKTGIMHSSSMIDFYFTELLMMQDVLNKGKLIKSSYARLFSSVNYVFKNRKKIEIDRYEKYFVEASKYENNILKMLVDYDVCSPFEKLKTICFLARVIFYKIVFRIAGSAERIFLK